MRARWPIVLFVLTACGTMRPGVPLRGTVIDAKGTPIAGAEVIVDGRTVTTTGGDGAFSLRCPAHERVAVTFRAPRFATTTKVLAARSGGINTVVVWPRAAAQHIRGNEGGRLTFPGATIIIPRDAFVDARGGSISGDVDVSLTAVDLNNRRQLDAAPGDFTARMRDGSIRRLETFGLFELAAESNGRAVEFGREKEATVQMEMRLGVPEEVPSFRFDTTNGLWIQQARPWRRRLFVAQSTGWWNADDPLTTTCIRVKVLDCKMCDNADTIVSGATVSATGKDYTGAVTSDTTDLNGIGCLFVKASAHVVLKVQKGGRSGESVEVATPSTLASVCDQNCPLTVVHLNDAALTNPLTSLDPTSWCATDDRANGSPFDTVWSATHANVSPSSVPLTIDSCTLPNCHNQPYASGEYKSNCFHGYGLYTVTITPPAQQWDNTMNDSKIKGLDTGFFTYTDGGDGTAGSGVANWHDEVDIELLGRKPQSVDYLPNAASPGGCINDHDLVVHTNYFAKDNVAAVLHERDYCVSYATHTYTFDWSDTQIIWTVDGQPLRTAPRPATWPAREDWPTQPGRLFMNLWGNSTTDAWADGPYGYNFPETATFSGVTAPP
jgi:beta-glucanase (GH16 family)